MKKLSSFCTGGILICCIIMFAVLSTGSFLVTAYLETAYEIEIQLKWNNPVISILFLIIYFFLLWGFAALYKKITDSTTPLLVLTCIWVFGFSLACSYFVKTGPSADCASVYYAAKQFAVNDFSSVVPYGSYFSCYPFQLGLAFFYEIIFRLSPSNSFHIIQGVNALLLVMTVCSQYQLIDCLFHSFRGKIYYLLLAATCLPFLMYGTYVYGDIPSVAFLSLGSLLLVLFFRHFKPTYGILAILSTACAVIVRKNSLIFLIAAGITMILFFFRHAKEQSKKKNILLLIYIVLFLTVSAKALPLVIHFYEYRSGSELNDGVPPSTYFAMGLMDSASGPGNYNGFNFITFTEDADYDAELASDLGWKAYQERIAFFVSNPKYIIPFFSEKIANQWSNAGWGVFHCLHFNFGERLPIIESCFSGPLYKVLVSYFGKYQMMLYLSVLIFFLSLWGGRKKHEVDVLVLLFPLTAVGGGIFSLIWESSGRYVLPYCLFMLPFCSMGINKILEVIFKNDK